MPYDWEDQSEGPQRAERIPPGTHRVRIAKVVYEKRGEPLRSKAGAPQILIVFQDAQAREGSMVITLSPQAFWVLRKLLQCCHPPINLARMKQDGIEPTRFAEPKFADRQLLNRHVVIQVEARNEDGEEFLQCMPIRQPTAGSESPGDPPLTQEEIPF
jgi:hypothetical protein